MRPLHIVLVESASRCGNALRAPAYELVIFRQAAAAYRAIADGPVDAVVVHVEPTADYDERVALVRRLQTEDATRKLPIMVVITHRPDTPTALTEERYGSAMIKLTTPDCSGVAESLAELMWEAR